MKNIVTFIVFIALLIILFCGCQGDISNEGHGSSDATENTKLAVWQTAYLEFLGTKKEEYDSFALVYIDDDDIPELYMSGVGEAVGDSVCTFKDGSVAEESLNRIGGGKYVERSGKIINCNGSMGRIYTHAYKLYEGEFVLTFTALSVEQVKYIEDEEYEISYEYAIEGKPVSEKEYNAAVEAVFDSSSWIPLDEDAVDFVTIRQQIINLK